MLINPLSLHQKPGFHLSLGRNVPCYGRRWGYHRFTEGTRMLYLGGWVIACGRGRYPYNGADYWGARLTRGWFFVMD
ncbi:MAG: hypothetical protein ACYDC1_22600 [Limisphaerales bacterium]